MGIGKEEVEARFLGGGGCLDDFCVCVCFFGMDLTTLGLSKSRLFEQKYPP